MVIDIQNRLLYVQSRAKQALPGTGCIHLACRSSADRSTEYVRHNTGLYARNLDPRDSAVFQNKKLCISCLECVQFRRKAMKLQRTGRGKRIKNDKAELQIIAGDCAYGRETSA